MVQRQQQQQEFHAVVLAGSGQRLYTLVENSAKALLPIANRPLLQYVLQWIETAGILTIHIVCPAEVSERVGSYIKKVYEPVHADTRLEMVTSNASGTAETLVALRDHIKSDFLVVSCDMVTNCPLEPMLNLFRLHRPMAIALFAEMPSLDTQTTGGKDGGSGGGKSSPSSTLDRDDGVYLGLDATNQRIVYWKSISDASMGDRFQVRTSLLDQYPTINMYANLRDQHAYIFDRAVLDVLAQKKDRIHSIREDLLPFLVKCQTSRELYDRENMEEFFRPSPFHLSEDTILSATEHLNAKGALSPTLHKAFDRMSIRNAASSMASSPAVRSDTMQHRLKCMAYVAGATNLTCKDAVRCGAGSGVVALAGASTALPAFTLRVQSPKLYAELNRHLSRAFAPNTVANTTPDSPNIAPTAEIHPKAQVGVDSLVGEDSKIGERTNVKKSVIGLHCTIGNNVKIVNCVLMDYVFVEDGVKLEGCVICHGARIKSKVTLKDVDIGCQHVVDASSASAGSTGSQGKFSDLNWK